MKGKFIGPLVLTAYKNVKWPFPTVDFEQVNFRPLFTKWLQMTAVYMFSGSRCTSTSPCNLSQLSYSESCQSGYIQTDGYPNNYENVVSGWRLLNRNGYTNLTLTFIHFEVTHPHLFWCISFCCFINALQFFAVLARLVTGSYRDFLWHACNVIIRYSCWFSASRQTAPNCH